MLHNIETVQSKLRDLRNITKDLKKQYEKVCAEWNDVELALGDLNHYQEILEFSPEGCIWLENTRRELLEERRNLKTLHSLLVPHVKLMAELNKSIEETPHYEPLRYGIRSIRGYNLFQELGEHVESSSRKFADLTGKGTSVNHIFSVMNYNPQLFERETTSVKKVDVQGDTLIVPPSEPVTEHQSLASKEQQNEWAKFKADNNRVVETEEERKARLERQLQTTLLMGSIKSKHWKG